MFAVFFAYLAELDLNNNNDTVHLLIAYHSGSHTCMILLTSNKVGIKPTLQMRKQVQRSW